jgi:hypothetical protein
MAKWGQPLQHLMLPTSSEAVVLEFSAVSVIEPVFHPC